MTIIVTQDGQRALASRCRDYRPAEAEPEFVYSADLKGPDQPARHREGHGNALEAGQRRQCGTRSRAGPIGMNTRRCARNGPSTKTKRKRKPTGKMALDASGNWSKMPRVMLAKCANMVALRAGWPETFAGAYAEEELDRAKAQDLTASEMVEPSASSAA
jgi:phage recombination protein Bet